MSLLDQLNADYPEAWRPDPGESILGEVVEISSRETEYGRYRIIVLKRDGDGARLAIHAFHQVLEQELARIQPQIGHRIGIKYLGKPEGKNYASYRAATENPAAVEWEKPPEVPESDIPNDFPAVNSQPVATGADDDIPF